MGIQTVIRHHLVLKGLPDWQYHAHNPPGGRETAPGTVLAGSGHAGRRAASDFWGAFISGSGRLEASHPGFSSNGGPNRPVPLLSPALLLRIESANGCGDPAFLCQCVNMQ